MNRQEVLEQMAPIMDLRVRDVEHGPHTRVQVTPDMVAFRPGSGRSYEVHPDGVRSMANFVGFPAHLASELRPDTVARVATELLARKGEYAVLMKEDVITGFAKRSQMRSISPERALATIERSIRGADFHRVLLLPNHAVQLETVGERQRPVVAGDLVQAGAMVAFSPIGTIQPLVQSYVLRLMCTNGVTSTDVLQEFHFGGEGDDVWHFFREAVRDAYRAVDRITARWRQMIEEQISPADRAMVLEAMLKEAGIRKEDAEVVRAWALAEPPQTSYDIMNLITRASSHLLEEPSNVIRAQRAVARFAEETEHRRICPVCRRSR